MAGHSAGVRLQSAWSSIRALARRSGAQPKGEPVAKPGRPLTWVHDVVTPVRTLSGRPMLIGGLDIAEASAIDRDLSEELPRAHPLHRRGLQRAPRSPDVRSRSRCGQYVYRLQPRSCVTGSSTVGTGLTLAIQRYSEAPPVASHGARRMIATHCPARAHRPVAAPTGLWRGGLASSWSAHATTGCESQSAAPSLRQAEHGTHEWFQPSRSATLGLLATTACIWKHLDTAEPVEDAGIVQIPGVSSAIRIGCRLSDCLSRNWLTPSCP